MITKIATAKSAVQKKISATKNMSESFVESASFWTAVLTLIFGGLAAVVGAAAWYFAHRESEIKDEKLARYQDESAAKIAEAGAVAALANEGQSKANQLAAEANVRVEELRKANLELETALLPRHFKDPSKAIGELKQFAGTKVMFVPEPYKECTNAALQIAFVLKQAKWVILPTENIPPSPWDGIWVQVGRSSDASDSNEFLRVERISRALVSQLNENGMLSAIRAADNRVPAGVIVLSIGPRLAPSTAKDIEEWMTRHLTTSAEQDRLDDARK